LELAVNTGPISAMHSRGKLSGRDPEHAMP
jgi:hypothetical protein